MRVEDMKREIYILEHVAECRGCICPCNAFNVLITNAKMNIFHRRRKIRIGDVYFPGMGCITPLSEWKKRNRVIDMSDPPEPPGFWVCCGIGVVP
jgi:hypothetical protein